MSGCFTDHNSFSQLKTQENFYLIVDLQPRMYWLLTSAEDRRELDITST